MATDIVTVELSYKYLSIAAASILAKTFRDDYMIKLHEEYPFYGWNHNAGYPTKEHRKGIEDHGTTPYHRMSFNLRGDGQLTLDCWLCEMYHVVLLNIFTWNLKSLKGN